MVRETRKRRARKDEPTPPCTGCGTDGGHVYPRGDGHPWRGDGAQHGRAGVFCRRCHEALVRARGRSGRPAVREAPPCSECGTTGGHARREGGRPVRYDGARLGLEGVLCHECLVADPDLAAACFRHSPIAAPPVPSPAEVRAGAAAIRDELVREAARLLAARSRRVAPVTPARGAKCAVREYYQTFIGKALRGAP